MLQDILKKKSLRIWIDQRRYSIIKDKEIEDLKFPMIISLEDYLFRLVTYENKEGIFNFYLTNLEEGNTWTSDIYNLDFLKKKIKDGKWKIVKSKLEIYK
jgi:hypothetical protein